MLSAFHLEKKQLFQEVLENKEGVEMKKIKYGEDSEIILIGEFSSVMKKELGFPIEHKFTYVTVKEVINEVTNQEKVNIKAFMQLDEITTRKVNGVDVPFRQGQLCDSTGVVKVAL